MLYAKAETREKKPNLIEQIKKNLRDLSNKKVAVGFPKGKLNSPHYENGESIIDVAIQNNYGYGVPRRDFMTPASKRWQKKCQQRAEEMGEDLTLGKINTVAFLELLGQEGQEIISEEIIKLHTPPNAPETIKRKGSSNPLVDSGDLSKAALYEIREKT